MPAIERHAWLREQASIRRLPQMAADLRQLKEEMEQLRSSLEERDRHRSDGPAPVSPA